MSISRKQCTESMHTWTHIISQTSATEWNKAETFISAAKMPLPTVESYICSLQLPAEEAVSVRACVLLKKKAIQTAPDTCSHTGKVKSICCSRVLMDKSQGTGAEDDEGLENCWNKKKRSKMLRSFEKAAMDDSITHGSQKRLLCTINNTITAPNALS